MKKGPLLTICSLALGILVFSGMSFAGEKGHGTTSGGMEKGSMSGMHGESGTGTHGMMKMGDKVFEGKVGPFHGEGRIVDMKAQMEKAKASGMKMEGMGKMQNTHHLSLLLTDPKTKEAVTEGKGSVTVTGPDGKKTMYDLTGMQGHFGADVNLDKPGKYDFSVTVEAEGKKGTADFTRTVR